jgi:hypothetical protein
MLTQIITRAGQSLSTLKKVLIMRSFSAALGIVGALAIAVTGFTGTASASISQCQDPWPNTRVCFWEHNNYGGNFYFRNSPLRDVCYNLPSTFNDITSSLYNRAGYRLHVFKDINCSNGWGYYEPFGAYSWVGDFSNDLISSYRLE